MRTQRKLVSYYEADRIAREGTPTYSMKNVYKTSSKVLLNQKQATGKVETPNYGQPDQTSSNKQNAKANTLIINRQENRNQNQLRG